MVALRPNMPYVHRPISHRPPCAAQHVRRVDRPEATAAGHACVRVARSKTEEGEGRLTGGAQRDFFFFFLFFSGL